MGTHIHLNHQVYVILVQEKTYFRLERPGSWVLGNFFLQLHPGMLIGLFSIRPWVVVVTALSKQSPVGLKILVKENGCIIKALVINIPRALPSGTTALRFPKCYNRKNQNPP
jgi:hypothetical protein